MGRPARRYRFRAEAGHVVSVDVGAHKVLTVVADLDGSVVASRRLTVQPGDPWATRLTAIDADGVWAVGAASTGMVDPAGTVALSVVPEWTGVDLAGLLADTFNCPVAVDNDCRLAAVAERWRRVAHGIDDLVYVPARTRTGAGLVVNGHLLRGAHGAAGEIGLLPAIGWERTQDHLRGSSDLLLEPLRHELKLLRVHTP